LKNQASKGKTEPFAEKDRENQRTKTRLLENIQGILPFLVELSDLDPILLKIRNFNRSHDDF